MPPKRLRIDRVEGDNADASAGAVSQLSHEMIALYSHRIAELLQFLVYLKQREQLISQLARRRPEVDDAALCDCTIALLCQLGLAERKGKFSIRMAKPPDELPDAVLAACRAMFIIHERDVARYNAAFRRRTVTGVTSADNVARAVTIDGDSLRSG